MSNEASSGRQPDGEQLEVVMYRDVMDDLESVAIAELRRGGEDEIGRVAIEGIDFTELAGRPIEVDLWGANKHADHTAEDFCIELVLHGNSADRYQLYPAGTNPENSRRGYNIGYNTQRALLETYRNFVLNIAETN